MTEPTNFTFNPNPALRAVTSTGRGEPDVSTNADPQTGYADYDPTLFAADGGFEQYGGTSFVSPQLNGTTAVIESYVGHRVGFWNPKIYKLGERRQLAVHPAERHHGVLWQAVPLPDEPQGCQHGTAGRLQQQQRVLHG